VKLCYN